MARAHASVSLPPSHPANTRAALAPTPQVLALYVKLGALFLKQVSKPLASQLKKTAVVHPTLSRFLTRLGQRMHESNARITAALKTEGEIANSGRKARPRLPAPGRRALPKSCRPLQSARIVCVRCAFRHTAWELGLGV